MRTTAITFLLLSVRCILLVVAVMRFAMAEETAPPSVSPSRPSPTSLPPPVVQSNFSPFRPSIAVIIGVLTTIFSVTFLILLYAKHCKRSAVIARAGHPSYAYGGAPSSYRRNSGVDRKVIDSLPVFRFASLRGPKDGLECAVCLNRFEPVEILRLLPKCKHAFHVECVDTWLESHSTCPLCRYRVDPEDVLLIIEEVLEPAAVPPPPPLHPPPKQEVDIPAATARVSGRHSSAGEKSTRSHIVPTAGSSSLSRVSADGGVGRKRIVDAVRSVGCFDRGGGAIRKDVLLLPDAAVSDRESFERRLSHRIIVSDSSALEGRRSGMKTSDLLFLRSEMIIDSGRYSFGPSDPSRLSVVSSTERHPVPEVRLDVANDVVSSRNSGRRSFSPSEVTGEPAESAAGERPIPEVDLDVVNDSVSGADGGQYRFGPSEPCPAPENLVSALEGRQSPAARLDVPKVAVPDRFLNKSGLINSPNPRSMSEITGLARLTGENKWHNRFSIS
ncbi:RING-H2 finger protein [Nymphaea thermarum]|nr:RING-H2 finger protein [Nymphaea thermarum]